MVYDQVNMKGFDENSMEINRKINSTEITFLGKQQTATNTQLQYVIGETAVCYQWSYVLCSLVIKLEYILTSTTNY